MASVPHVLELKRSLTPRNQLVRNRLLAGIIRSSVRLFANRRLWRISPSPGSRRCARSSRLLSPSQGYPEIGVPQVIIELRRLAVIVQFRLNQLFV